MASVIVCPACGTRYEIAATIPPEGRKVRCSKCSHVWQAVPQAVAPNIPVARPQRPMAQPSQQAQSAQAAPQTQPSPQPAPANPALRGFAGIPGAAPQSAAAQPPLAPPQPSVAPQPAPAPTSSEAADADFGGGDFDVDFDHFGETASAANGAGSPPALTEASETGFVDWDKLAYPPATTEPRPMSDVSIGGERRTSRLPRAVAMGWALLVLFVLGVVGLFLLAPNSVVSMVPGASRLYAMLGMPVNLRGLAFQDVAYKWTNYRGETILEVNGNVVNLTDFPQKLPILVVDLRDEKDNEISQWTTPESDEPVKPGAIASFTAEINSPPANARSIKVRFAKAK